MHINATLFGQMITFGIFVWFTMRVIWPLLIAQLNERKKRIADGLAAAEQGNKMLTVAQEQAQARINEAKQQCSKLLEDADQQANTILEQSRQQAIIEREAIIKSGHAEVFHAVKQAKAELQVQVAHIAILGAEKILQRSINPNDHQEILNSLAKKLA